MRVLKLFVVTACLFTFAATLISLRLPESEGDDSPTDSLVADREKHIAEVRAAIKGKEKLPADSVFKNLKHLGKMPAGRVLAIMNIAYSKSLGVSCGHCHNTQDYASDEKAPKKIAREMWTMSRRINDELLKGIPDLKEPVVNCTTCHRGQKKPALDIP
jgi:hypothetical protein